MNPSSSGWEKDLFSAVAVVVGLFVVCTGLSDVYGAYRSTSWVSTPGVIIFSGVSSAQGEGATHQPKASYKYTVKNLAYESKRISFGSKSTGDLSAAESWVHS